MSIRVLIINETLQLGGAESLSVELANALVEQRMEVYFASFSGPLTKRLNPKIIFFEIPKYSLLSAKKIIDNISKIILEVNPNIIHSHGATLAVLTGISAHEIGSKSIKILTRHSRRPSRLPSFLATYLLNKYCDHIIAISNIWKQNLQKMGISSEKISVIPNFIDCEYIDKYYNSFNKEDIYKELNLSEGEPIITMVGRLIPEKRFDRFIKIIYLCSEKMKIRLTGLIIGDGPERNKLEKLATNYIDRVNIIFLGYQNDVYKYLFISNVFLFPSKEEVLPMALIEATAAGVPIVCSNILGNSDIVMHNYNGFLVNDKEEEYANFIIKILTDKDLATELSNNGKEIARKKFDKKIVINQVVSLYERLINEGIHYGK
jgi:glycosyltransferase involved in cell wall biosynthesis